jgi:hypothetical protein
MPYLVVPDILQSCGNTILAVVTAHTSAVNIAAMVALQAGCQLEQVLYQTQCRAAAAPS